jgi:glutamine---fructose-6-phosphate transaminase (isomerizing)
MCGIFGYVGSSNSSEIILEGLRRLEYRGYDSWGISVISNGDFGMANKKEIKIVKKVGEIGDLGSILDLPYSNIGIGHTRWATHGGVTNYNAHPHFATDKSFVLAQNGIVENYQELKSDLSQKGYKFETETDTEVIVRQVELRMSEETSLDPSLPRGELHEAVRLAFLDLKGRNTIIVLSSEDSSVVAIRNGSPLVIGVGKGEYFFASDTLSFADKTNRVIYVEDKQMVVYKDGVIRFFDVVSGKEVKFDISKLDHDDPSIDKEGFEHFMIKEIVEQKHTIAQAVTYKLDEIKPLVEVIKASKKVYTIGAGTAFHAAGQIAYLLRKVARVDATELRSYDIGSYENLFCKDDLMIVVSQSGETADTIEAIEIAKSKGAKIASIVNMVGSTITRMSHYPYFSRSGPEICVASTKAFTAQVAWGFLVCKSVIGEYERAKDLIAKLSVSLENFFSEELFSDMKKLAKKLKSYEHFFVLGKGQNFYTALEGALKVKEITYKHFEGFSAGELKHGVIALIEKGTPVFGIIADDDTRSDMLSSLAEVKARGAFTIAIASQANDLFDKLIKVPSFTDLSTVPNIIPFQLLSYFLALELGHSPDKPRNLAKSVTVK